jgi:glycosyltransferase involved in cell wall biosynthesis
VRLVTVGEVGESPGVDIRTRPLPTHPIAAVRAAWGFLKDIHSFAPDLLHLHYAGGKLATMATLAGVRPLVVSVMGGDVLPEQHEGGLSALERRATRRVLDEADLILVKSHALLSVLPAFGDAAAKAEVVRWGVDPERFRRDLEAGRAMRERLGVGPEDRVVLSPRPLRPLYNVHLVVDAMASVLRRVPAALLVVTEYGADPVYRAALEGRASELGIGKRVRFVGARSPGEMPALYSLAEVAVSVPFSDGLPQSLFEAMAGGCPVVVGRLPAYDEILDDHTAVRVELASEPITEAIVRVLTDDRLREGLRARARDRVVQRACLPAEVARVDALYRAAVSGARPRRRLVPLAVDALSLLVR